MNLKRKKQLSCSGKKGKKETTFPQSMQFGYSGIPGAVELIMVKERYLFNVRLLPRSHGSAKFTNARFTTISIPIPLSVSSRFHSHARAAKGLISCDIHI